MKHHKFRLSIFLSVVALFCVGKAHAISACTAVFSDALAETEVNQIKISVARRKSGHLLVSRTEHDKAVVIAAERTIEAPIVGGPIDSAVLSPNGKLLAVIVQETSSMIVIDLQSLTQIKPAETRISLYEAYQFKKILSLSFNREGSRVAVLDETPYSRLQSLIIYKIKRKLSGGNYAIELIPIDINTDGVWFGKVQNAPTKFKSVNMGPEPDVVHLVGEDGKTYLYKFRLK